MSNTNEKAQPGSATYIETIYGTKTFARALMLDDAQSIMDLMDDYADHASKSRIAQLESDLAKSQEKCKAYEGALTNIGNQHHSGGIVTYLGNHMYLPEYANRILAEQALKPKDNG